jgi:hypothetical protein
LNAEESCTTNTLDSGLFVKAAVSKNETVVEHFVAELDDAQNVKPIATLPAVFM